MSCPDSWVHYKYLIKEPGLHPYRSQVEEILRRRQHTLSAEVEGTLAALADTLDAPFVIWQQTMAADLALLPIQDPQGRDIPLSIAQYRALEQAADRDVRRRAYASLTAGLAAHKATLAATLITCIKRTVTLAHLRHYASAADMILATQQVPVAVYRTSLDITHAEAAPHLQRLMRLRSRLLGVEPLTYYDLVAPLGPDAAPPVTRSEGTQLLQEALHPLGEAYGALLSTGVAKRWIDWADNQGKQPQATCHPVAAVHPYVSLPWHNTLHDVFLLAHKLGHVAHFELGRQRQVYSNTLWAQRGAFFVEVPAMVTELLLGQHLLATTSNPHLRRWILGQCLGTFHGIVVSLIGAHLERYLYDLTEAGTPLTLTTLMEAQEAMFRLFYGETLIVDDGARLRWMQAPHFYFADLRQATYVVGLACGYAVIEGMHTEGQPAVTRWLQALEAGSTLSPLRLMQRAGVDMTTPEPIRRTVAYFGSLVDELERSFAPPEAADGAFTGSPSCCNAVE